LATKPLAMEHRYYERGATCIYYQVAGAGPPLVLVHGLSASTRWWARNVGALARRFRVYVVDLIGFGGSRDGEPFVLERASAQLADWMEHLGIERANLVGHSMGGFISVDLAADHPHRVDKLVLVAAAALPLGRGYVRHSLGLVRGIRHLPLSFLPILITDAYRAGPKTIWKAAQELLSTDIAPKLARIEAPSLLLWGANDTIVPPDIGRGLERDLPNARLVMLQGAGHNPMWDRPHEFNRLVLDFLTGQEVEAQPAERRHSAA
jgi:pimeloyl-ACP methyl ester carboxylesterase